MSPFGPQRFGRAQFGLAGPGVCGTAQQPQQWKAGVAFHILGRQEAKMFDLISALSLPGSGTPNHNRFTDRTEVGDTHGEIETSRAWAGPTGSADEMELEALPGSDW